MPKDVENEKTFCFQAFGYGTRLNVANALYLICIRLVRRRIIVNARYVRIQCRMQGGHLQAFIIVGSIDKTRNCNYIGYRRLTVLNIDVD